VAARMGQKIAAPGNGLDEGDPSVTVEHHYFCSCQEDCRPSSASSTVLAVYSASRDEQDLESSDKPLDVEKCRQIKTGTGAQLKTVVHTEDEIRVGEEGPEELAELKAEAKFKYLREDWNEEAMRVLTQEVGQLALSRERVKVVLQHTQDKRLSCAQLNDLIKLCSLETHKEQVLFERYPHLTDRNNFETQIVNVFTLSKSVRGSLMRKLTKFLTSMPKVFEGSFDLRNDNTTSESNATI